MNIKIKNDLIEKILSAWKDLIGADDQGYRERVYRLFNFCLALQSCTEEDQTKFAISACFQNIGLWSAHTVDHIPPSVADVQNDLFSTERQERSEEMSLMIKMHHKVRTCKTDHYPLVKPFRKGDLVDFFLDFFTFCLPTTYICKVKQAIPNHGFHRFLLKGARDWLANHPFSPPPVLTWQQKSV